MPLDEFKQLPINTLVNRPRGYRPSEHVYLGRRLLDDGYVTDEGEILRRVREQTNSREWIKDKRPRRSVMAQQQSLSDERPGPRHRRRSSSSDSSTSSDPGNDSDEEDLPPAPLLTSTSSQRVKLSEFVKSLAGQRFSLQHLAAWGSRIQVRLPDKMPLRLAAAYALTGVVPWDWQEFFDPDHPQAPDDTFDQLCLTYLTKFLEYRLGSAAVKGVREFSADSSYDTNSWCAFLLHLGFTSASFELEPPESAWAEEFRIFGDFGSQCHRPSDFCAVLATRPAFLDSALAWIVTECIREPTASARVLLDATDLPRLQSILTRRLERGRRVEDDEDNSFLVKLFLRLQRLYWSTVSIDAELTERALWQQAICPDGTFDVTQRAADDAWVAGYFHPFLSYKLPPRGTVLPRSRLYPPGSGDREVGGKITFRNGAYGPGPSSKPCPDDHYYLSQVPHSRYVELYPTPQSRLSRALPGASASAVLHQRVVNNAPLTTQDILEINRETARSARAQLQWLSKTLTRSEHPLVKSLFAQDNRGERCSNLSLAVSNGEDLSLDDWRWITDLHQWVWAANSGTIVDLEGSGGRRELGGWFTRDHDYHSYLDAQDPLPLHDESLPVAGVPPITHSEASQLDAALGFCEGGEAFSVSDLLEEEVPDYGDEEDPETL
jgi:hypothetical protein